MDAKLGLILDKIRQETGVPGAAAVVVSHDAVIAQAASGVRRSGFENPVTIHDHFHIGSNAKAMTATLCAVLVHNRRLNWQTTVLDVFPELKETMLPAYKPATLEMLLSHTAGVPAYTDDEAEDYAVPDLDGVPLEQQVTNFSKWLLQNRPPINSPGTEFAYSNAGYSIAAAMAEAVTGASYVENMNKHVFAPLEMEATVASGWPALLDPNQPWGHLVKEDKIIPHPPDDKYQLDFFLAPAGDVYMSLPDYGKFLQINLKGLQNMETIIPNTLIQRMHNHGKPGYGMGWGVVGLRSLEALGMFSTHAGSAGTFLIAAGISHERDLAAALVINAGKPEAAQGIKKIIAAFSGQV